MEWLGVAARVCSRDAREARARRCAPGLRRAAAGTSQPASCADGGCDYQVTRRSNSKAGWGAVSAEGSCSAPVASHRGGPRAGAIWGGAVSSPRWTMMSRTVGPSVMKAMMRIAPPQWGHTSGKTSQMRASSSAQAYRARPQWAGSALAAGGEVVAASARVVTAVRSAELGAIISLMRRATTVVVASLLGGLAWAAPVDSFAQQSQIRSVAAPSIDSEASLEYFIGLADRLLKGDSSKDLVAMATRLESLKTQKKALQQSILEKERETAGKQAAGAAQAERAARAQLDSLQAQVARVELSIKEILLQIQRLQDKERREQDEIKAAEDALDRFSQSLANAALRRTAVAGEISSMDAFARGLSAAKKKETEDRIRKALAQLAEARRARLSLRGPVSAPALRVAPR